MPSSRAGCTATTPAAATTVTSCGAAPLTLCSTPTDDRGPKGFTATSTRDQEGLESPQTGCRASGVPSMVIVGDRIRLRLMKGSERVGVVTGITGTMLRVRWAPNEESTVIPGPGTLTVLGRATRKASPPRKQTTAAAKKATSKNTPSKRPAAKGASQ